MKSNRLLINLILFNSSHCKHSRVKNIHYKKYEKNGIFGEYFINYEL